MKSLDEKLRYNSGRKAPFSTGYGLGVTLYRDYIRQDKDGKKVISETINASKAAAREGDELCKGIMCGVRDAANERKAKKRK